MGASSRTVGLDVATQQANRRKAPQQPANRHRKRADAPQHDQDERQHAFGRRAAVDMPSLYWLCHRRSGIAAAITTANNVICIGARRKREQQLLYRQHSRDDNGKHRRHTSNDRLRRPARHDEFFAPVQEGIKPMDKASEAILALKPVRFRYKSDTKEHTAIWLDRRGSGQGESRSWWCATRRRNLHRALRRGERDVAQRVSQRAPQSGGTGSNDCAAKVNDCQQRRHAARSTSRQRKSRK